MSKQDIDYALGALETALSVISNNVVMPVSGNIYPFYQDAKRTLVIAKKAMDDLYEHPHKEERYNTEDYEPPTTCYCNATNFPPCSFCTREADESVLEKVVKK